ncbi:MAG: MarR family transcriptional regulator [Methanobrevibacter sp.]|uniref:MarR family transcriptional regulator n=1 Tax=Methanobrevibacter sp. TaxID=66852 RepID=UPI001B6111B9|nr:helix-turn-helix domain-containing protein [Methanobrevibacter sp.]MBP3791692.1 MarR family transcriptional regulator [Methanobrevibacter sp.]
MDEREFYGILGYIKISPYRTNTLKTIGNELKIPSEIAKELDVRTSQVSAALHDLKEKKLVVCVNEDARKGRLYKCTQLGLEIMEKL